MPEDFTRAKRILDGHIPVAEVLAYMQSDCFLTKNSAAKFIDHKTDRVIEDAIRRGHLRAFRVGKKTLIKKSDLETWIQAGEITCEIRENDKNDLQKLASNAIERARANIDQRRTRQ